MSTPATEVDTLAVLRTNAADETSVPIDSTPIETVVSPDLPVMFTLTSCLNTLVVAPALVSVFV